MSKKSVPLSEIVQQAVSDLNPSPPVQRFQVLANLTLKVEASCKPLRSQMIEKMKKYIDKNISDKEMFYVFCLCDHLVVNSHTFRKQVLDIDFIMLLETIGQFKNKPTFTRNRTPENIVNKIKSMIQQWGNKFPNELAEYDFLYEKYKQLGIKFPEMSPVKGVNPANAEQLPQDIKKLIATCKVKEKEIQDTIKSATHVEELIQLYREVTDLNCQLVDSQTKIIQKRALYDSEKVDKLNAFVDNYQSCLQLLANQININRTYHITTTVPPVEHGASPFVESENPKDIIADRRIGILPGEKAPVIKNPVGLLKPPPSNGIPLISPVHRTVSMYEDEFNKQVIVSSDSYFSTDSLGTENVNEDTDFETPYLL
ncbi:hypothetical protein EIN_094990 [Entamoeba invadens IP1]|uniref:VHS domain-containing protein n=1 Tax=Entamoeba invadens IP1 TaxID=370355 RepID=A0A0A1U047_ENTIV|nr:hypothetical protein EIN_094990 [Entamoeba invadens IP1]ELP87262.1 hypothetical protein EIN_094990 [Entamoeba invadens IP1]|eukprot:XP_004254033.1 hypothetical protein EIN_094990 [Entamoeba invadens IP1]